MRRQTLRVAIEWSYELLTQDEQRLSVFAAAARWRRPSRWPASTSISLSRTEQADDLLRQSLVLADELGHAYGLSSICHGLSIAAVDRGEPREAHEWLAFAAALADGRVLSLEGAAALAGSGVPERSPA